MRSGLRFLLALLLLISFSGGLVAGSRPHCSPPLEAISGPESHTDPGSAPHSTHHGPAPATTVAAQGDHECGHCPPADCRAAEHCAAGAAAALSAAAPALHIAAAWMRPSDWRRDRPLSANPTPPIPPPQVLL